MPMFPKRNIYQNPNSSSFIVPQLPMDAPPTWYPYYIFYPNQTNFTNQQGNLLPNNAPLNNSVLDLPHHDIVNQQRHMLANNIPINTLVQSLPPNDSSNVNDALHMVHEQFKTKKIKKSMKSVSKFLSSKYYGQNLTIETYKNPFDYSAMATDGISAYGLKKQRSVEKKLSEDMVHNWRCLLCPEKLKNKENLLDHYEKHKKVLDELEDQNLNAMDEDDGVEAFCCPVCSISFNAVSHYKQHITSKHRPKDYSCDLCDLKFTNNFYLTVHIAKHIAYVDTYVCAACKEFTTKSNDQLMAHLETAHNTEKHFCDECGETFLSKAWFNDHKIFHIKARDSLSCKQCNVYFGHVRYFDLHMKRTHNIAPAIKDTQIKYTKYKCSDCNLTFPLKRNLEGHRRQIHSTENSYLCNDCGRSFSLMTNLKQHMKVHKEGQYICNICGKKFKKNQHLTIHMRIHTGEKPYKCHLCERSFSQRPPLTLHLRTHTGERPYPCRNCKKGYISKTTRYYHQKTCKKSPNST